MTSMAGTSGPGRPVHDHEVGFFDDDEALVEHVARFVDDSLRAGSTVVLVVTAAHRAALELGLGGRGHVRCLDAADLLATFMGDDGPDAERFDAQVGGLLADAAADGRPVRAFGEMVGLLWDAGDVAGAVALESLWNDLAQRLSFSLLCAYLVSPDAGDRLDGLGRVCEQHSAVVGPVSVSASVPAWSDDAGEVEASRLFVPVPSAVREARRFVSEQLAAWDRADLVDAACLVVSELATNAVRHAGSPFRLSLGRGADGVTVAVEDRSAALPVRRRPTLDARGGRGIPLVDSLSSRWGADAGGPGKIVWSVVAPA